MLFRTHAALGILIGLLIIPKFHYSPTVFCVCVLASLIPDMDSTRSFIGNRFYLRPIQWIVKHRGFFHSLTACVILSIIVWSFAPGLAFAFFVGYAAHLLIDSFTVEGVTPFWPVGYKTEGTFTTGNLPEKIIFFVLCLAIIVLVLSFLFR